MTDEILVPKKTGSMQWNLAMMEGESLYANRQQYTVSQITMGGLVGFKEDKYNIEKIQGHRVITVEGDDVLYVRGGGRVYITGDCQLQVKGSVTTECDGDYIIKAKGNVCIDGEKVLINCGSEFPDTLLIGE